MVGPASRGMCPAPRWVDRERSHVDTLTVDLELGAELLGERLVIDDEMTRPLIHVRKDPSFNRAR